MKNIDESEFNNIIQKDVTVLIEFGADWCGPCKKMKPLLDDLEKELQGKVEIYFLDIGKSQTKAIEYEVLSIPQILVFRKGKLLERIFGEQKKDNLKKLVEKHIQS